MEVKKLLVLYCTANEMLILFGLPVNPEFLALMLILYPFMMLVIYIAGKLEATDFVNLWLETKCFLVQFSRVSILQFTGNNKRPVN